jgi:hypothetical protein
MRPIDSRAGFKLLSALEGSVTQTNISNTLKSCEYPGFVCWFDLTPADTARHYRKRRSGIPCDCWMNIKKSFPMTPVRALSVWRWSSSQKISMTRIRDILTSCACSPTALLHCITFLSLCPNTLLRTLQLISIQLIIL